LSEKTKAEDKLQSLSNEKAYLSFRVGSLQEHAEALEADVASWRRKSADYLENYEKLLLKYRHT